MAVVRKEEADLQCSSSHARGNRPWGCATCVLLTSYFRGTEALGGNLTSKATPLISGRARSHVRVY